MNVLLKGLVGSTAYGLDNESSDKDYLGIYAEPTIKFHGLDLPINKKATQITKNPDTAMHEVLKFVSLCLKSNPTCNELLWLPADCYVAVSALGEELCRIRKSFFSKKLVYNAYLGYGYQQFKDLENRGGTFGPDLANRTEKHARHLLRLCDQGVELWETGNVTVRVKDPARYIEFGKFIANSDPELALSSARTQLALAEMRMDDSKTWLPDVPDFELANDWLLRVRAFYL